MFIDHTERSRQQPNLIRDTSKDWQKSNSSRDDGLCHNSFFSQPTFALGSGVTRGVGAMGQGKKCR